MTAPAVVRVAPSPTGDPHVGTAYMALFNFLLARTTGGRFILRIEDTDRTRYDAGAEALITESLEWLGLAWDEGPTIGGPSGPYRQSERTELYVKHAEDLLASGGAYRCFCTAERLSELRKEQRSRKQNLGYDGLCRGLGEDEIAARLAEGAPHVVRLAIPKDRTIVFEDALRGEVSIEGATIDDQVLIKTDGFPTYHLAVVVDDHLMGVTDVIRAEEWITSTPKHVFLYEAFGWEQPTWRHMPILRNKDHSKISKRKNPTSLTWYRDEGFLPEALLNFLGLMGYSLPDGREVFDLATMLREFDADRISTTGPIFDMEKLSWLNGEHIRGLEEEDLTTRILEHLRRRHDSLPVDDRGEHAAVLDWIEGHGGFDASEVRAHVLATVPLIRERLKILDEYSGRARALFAEDVSGYAGGDLVPKKQDAPSTRAALETTEQALADVATWDVASVEAALRALPEKVGWKARDVFLPVRVAITGSRVSPPLFETVHLIGRERCAERLRAAAALLEHEPPAAADPS